LNLHEAKRPVLVYGAGIQCCRKEARELAELLQIPVVTTWGAADLLPHSHPLNIGTFGTHGTRGANFSIQNAGFLLCIGTRLDTKATGTPAQSFARAAHIVMVDIDRAEIAKMEKCGVKVNGINLDAREFMLHLDREGGINDMADWIAKCQDWKRRFPPIVPDVIHELSNRAQEGDIIVSDTGCAVAWMMQGFKFKEGQRFLHPFNNTPMGYALPGAIGAHYATGKRVICVTGDGAIMMAIGELATIAQRRLPIEITVLNNHSHSMCMQSEREWFNSKYAATTQDSGLSFPNFDAVLKAFDVLKWNVVEISPDFAVSPKNKSGLPIEDQHPLLSREELRKEMVIPLWGSK
jgi:acetolactate synthase-1/2/3 large subunit